MTKRGISSPAEDYEAAGLSRPARAGLLAVAVGVLLSAGCASNDLSGSATAPKKAEDLQVVDCRLPADVRQIGRQFIYHRQTIKTGVEWRHGWAGLGLRAAAAERGDEKERLGEGGG